MVHVGSLVVDPPLINSSSPWASDEKDLAALFKSPYTGAVTTRTATISGFEEDPNVHQVAFATGSASSVNSYGYSPHPLRLYLDWVSSILLAHPSSSKPFIISITSSDPSELYTMLDIIQDLRAKTPTISSRIGVELNTSCPNIKDKPPPSYNTWTLRPLVEVLAAHVEVDSTLTVGIKLPPYVHAGQFQDVVSLLQSFEGHPISFLTCTNTLGSSLLFADQVGGVTNGDFALPTVHGGLAGDSIHALSLGNVHAFKTLLTAQGLSNVAIIGVGGVTSREAAGRMRRAGATVVACATALGLEGVGVFKRLS